MKRIIVLTACLALCGCTPNFAKSMKALGNDRAVFIGSLQTVYGTGKVVRIGETTNSVTVSPDGTVTVNAQR